MIITPYSGQGGCRISSTKLPVWVVVGDQQLSAPAPAITFSGLDGEKANWYKLLIHFVNSTLATQICLRLNGDAGANYNYQITNAIPTNTFEAQGYAAQTEIVTSSLWASGELGMGEILIYAPASSVGHMVTSFIHNNTPDMHWYTGRWAGTDAINEIKLFTKAPFANNWDTGSRATLMALMAL